MGYHIRLYLILALLLPGFARSEPPAPRPPVLDIAAVPFLGAEGRADYGRFLQQATPRAFAISADGAWGWAAAQPDAEATDARAISLCGQWGGGECRIYARDLAVVWPGLEAAAPPPPPRAALDAGPGWSLVPDERFIWQGPKAARGAYVWAHGRAAGGQDSRGSQPQPHVRVFNNAGYDVLRFDRDPATDDTDRAAVWLHGALSTLRSAGYARVIVGGQSRGAWNALQALDTPGLVDAVIAVAPAAHGATGSPAWAWAMADLRAVVEAARSPATRVVVASFANDEFDPDPEKRAALLRQLQRPKIDALLFLDRPREVTGHGGGSDARFTFRYGTCLLDFVEGHSKPCG